jgi:hypothetical protein
MTSRKRFERWALRQKLKVGRLEEVTRDGPRSTGYFNRATQVAWLAWEAQRRHYSAGAVK